MKNLLLITFLIVQSVFSINNPLTLINSDLNDGTISLEDAIELKTRVILLPESLPLHYHLTHVDKLRCGADIMSEAEEYKNSFPSDLINRMNNISRTTNNPNTEYYYTPEENFRIGYQTSGSDAPSQYDGDNSGVPDYIEDMGQYFEDALVFQVDTLGFNNPLDFTTASQFIVTVENLEGVYGYVPGNSYHRIWMDNSLSDRFNKLTSAHELHHLSQHSYTVGSSWYKECTSMWVEEAMYDNLDGYNGYEQAFQQNPPWSLDYFQSGGLYQYGSVIWNLYIEQNYGRDAIRTIWEKPYGSATTAANSFFNDQSSSLSTEFIQFSAWNFFTGFRANGSYPDGEHEEADNFTPASYTAYGSGSSYTFNPGLDDQPDHLGCNYVKVNSNAGSGHLLITFDGESNTDWYVKLLTNQSNNYNGLDMSIDENGYGFYILNNWDDFSDVTIAPMVLNTYGNNNVYTVSAEVIQNMVNIESIITETSSGDSYAEPGDTVEVVVTMTNYGNSLNNAILELSPPNSSDFTMLSNTVTFSSVSTGETVSNSNSPFIFFIDESIENGMATFTFSLTEDGNDIFDMDWEMNVGIPGIIFIDDDDNDNDILTPIENVLVNLNQSYEVVNRDNISLSDLQLELRDLIIWNTGSVETNALQADDQAVLIDHLSNGKNLFLLGNHLGEQLSNTEILNDKLLLRYAGNRTTAWLKGTPGDPISVNSTNWILLSLDFSGVDSLSTMGDPRASVTYYFNGDEDHGGMMRYSSQEYRAILSNFDLADIDDSNDGFLDAETVIEQVLNYLLSDVVYPELPVLVSPELMSNPILDATVDSVDFTWSLGGGDGSTQSFFLSENVERVDPIISYDISSGNSLALTYDELYDIFGYVEDKSVYWGVYTSLNGEVTVSELREIIITVREELGSENELNIPKHFALNQNYPNPFNPITNIDFELPKAARIHLSIIDIEGREVMSIVNNVNLEAGHYNYTLNSTGLPSGMYFYKMMAVPAFGQTFTATKKLVLLK